MPARERETDMPFLDERRNLMVCPLLHDGNFMQIFYEGWELVQQFLAADVRLPVEAALPRSPMRQVARMLADRREFLSSMSWTHSSRSLSLNCLRPRSSKLRLSYELTSPLP